MKKVIHTANSRGRADHGWLQSYHTFSFADYVNSERMQFGMLRVLNDDTVEPLQGFPTHQHKNMEIISIPLSGALKHKDSVGNETIIRDGEVQIMSAGTGVLHSEYNASDRKWVNFLQIWVFPEKKDIMPRYDQQAFPGTGRQNCFQTIVSPMQTPDKGVKINQQAYFSLADIDNKKLEYTLKKTDHGIYVFVIEGSGYIAGEKLNSRDAIGVTGAPSVEIQSDTTFKLLVIEVPQLS